jgi:hypothetical protein|tara:strand:+ start:468 stop:662 length:195 start_codon:yes stop_codon:yes gene_type:complete
MTVPELMDRLEKINESMNLGDEEPRILNEYAVKGIQKNVRTLISDLEDDGIEGNEGYRMAGRVW